MRRLRTFLIILILALFIGVQAWAATLIMYPKFKGLDSSGAPLVGGLLYTYEPGTTTAKATYTDRASGTPNTNPVVLDSNGEATIYGTGYYKFVLKTAAGATVWTLDNLRGANEVPLTTIGDYNNDFDSAVTSIGATPTTLYIDATATMSANVTVPSTLTIVLQKGGSIDQAGNTLTINGPLVCNGGTITNDSTLTINGSLTYGGQYAVLSSTSYGTFGAAIQKIYPEFWGANSAPGTTDMTAEIQAALDSGADIIEGTPGSIYLTSSTVTIGSNTRLTNIYLKAINDFGDNPLVRNETTTPGSMGARDHDIIIDHVKIDGNRANNSTGTQFSHGISLVACAQCEVTNNRVIECLGDGIYIGSYSASDIYNSDIEVGGNYVYNVYRNGIASTGAERMNIHDNRINKTIAYHGIDLEPEAAGNIMKNITIAGNNITLTNRSGIALALNNIGAADMEAINVTGNTISSPADATYGHGIQLNGVVRPTNITSNIIYDAGAYGIFLDNTSIAPKWINIAGNTIVYADNISLYIVGDYNTVSSNIIIADAGLYAINVNGVNYNAISGNMIYLETVDNLHGIDMQNTCKFNAVTGNVIVGPDTTNFAIGIYDRDGYDNAITGNVTTNAYYGVRLYTGSNTPDEESLRSQVGLNATYGNASGYGYNDNRIMTQADIVVWPGSPVVFDTSSNAISATLADGQIVGQRVTATLKTDGGNDVTFTVAHHVTSDPEVFTFDDAGDSIVLEWSGVDWMTVYNNGVTVP